MALITRRAADDARVTIDYEKCNLCGLCLRVCKGGPLHLSNGRIEVDYSVLLGCIGCGQCAAICPLECITVVGRTLEASHLLPLPPRTERTSYEQLYNLMLSRRSIRCFKAREVEAQVIDQIIDAASTAPMGLPPSEVEVKVLNGFKQVEEFSRDMIKLIQQQKWVFSPLMLQLYRPFVGREVYDMMRTFLTPLPDFFAEKMAAGENWLLYGAPLAMYFYSSPTADPADPMIAATYAMLAAEALGLGTCMIGTIAPFLKRKTWVGEKYGIPAKDNQGLMVIFGYPEFKYHRAV
ncbi:MAG: nitroreductase family protein, partial [Methylocystaceae bacterium]